MTRKLLGGPSKQRRVRMSMSRRAGLVFPVARFKAQLKKKILDTRISKGTAIYLAASLEYLCAELLELAGNVARSMNYKRINPRHLMLAIRNDAELNALLSKVDIPDAGVVPSINMALIKHSSKSSASTPDPFTFSAPKKTKTTKKTSFAAKETSTVLSAHERLPFDPKDKGDYQWYFDDKMSYQADPIWRPYVPNVSGMIDEEFLNHKTKGASATFTTPEISRFVDDIPQTYFIDFTNGTQTNTKTRYVRSIMRKKL